MLHAIRCGVGNGSGGGENEGWNPPTLTTKLASSPQAMSSPISPFEGNEEDARLVQAREEPDPLRSDS